jgi:hypothetical protein
MDFERLGYLAAWTVAGALAGSVAYFGLSLTNRLLGRYRSGRLSERVLQRVAGGLRLFLPLFGA